MKAKYVVLTIGIVALVVGSIGLGAGIWAAGGVKELSTFQPFDAGTRKLDSFNIDELRKIDIWNGNGSVTILKTTDSEISMDYLENDHFGYTDSFKDGKLRIHNTTPLDTAKSFFNAIFAGIIPWGLSTEKQDLVVRIPENLTFDIDIWSGNGDIRFEEGFVNNSDSEIDIYSGNGNVYVKNQNVKEIEISTGNKSINIADCTAQKIDVELGNGQVKFSGNIIAEELEVRTGNGNIETVDEGTLLTADGEIYTGNGSINVRLNGTRNDFNIKSKTGWGNIDISGSNNADAPNKLKVTTGNGNITVSFTA